jgi:hypothetical protein
LTLNRELKGNTEDGITVFSWDHSILVGSQYFSLCDDNLTISCGEITLLTLNRENIF